MPCLQLDFICYAFLMKDSTTGTSLAVQWLRLCDSSTGDVGSIPGGGTKIPHAVQTIKILKKKINSTTA